MLINAIFSRWAKPRGAALNRSASTYPSSTQSSSGGDSIWQTLLQRLIPGEPDPWGAVPVRQPALVNNMPAARAEFEACLQGLHGEHIEELLRSIRRSRSLRDLWHLRTWLYTEVARTFSQGEAEQRLLLLNAHFHPAGASAKTRPH